MIEIFDGAMGTMLQKGGLRGCPELMNIEKAEEVRRIHEEYIEAGSTIITTNTFGGTKMKLSHYGLEKRMREINIAGVKIAKEAARGRAKVAGDIGPTGKFIKPLGELEFEEAYENFYEQAEALAEGGADYIIIETSIELQEMRAAILAVKEACNLPIISQFSYAEDGRTVTGTDPQTAAIILEAMGAAVIGVNCSLGPSQLVPIVKKLSESANVPISVQPNAGLPYLENGKTKFPMDAETFGRWAEKLIEAGARYIGGCCGTTPNHIRELCKNIKEIKIPEREKKRRKLYLASRSRTIEIDKEKETVLIGERINPTGRKKLGGEIREGKLMSVKREALNQIKAGAEILDVNMGVGGIDEAEAMRKAVIEIAQLTDAPLSIDTGNYEALEAGLRNYPGRALINSVTYEKERLEKYLPF